MLSSLWNVGGEGTQICHKNRLHKSKRHMSCISLPFQREPAGCLE